MKVVHCKKSPYDVLIARPSIWGNPYSWQDGTLAKFKVNTRLEAIVLYKWHLVNSPSLLLKLSQFKGDEVLGCWCDAEKDDCHGNCIIEVYQDIKNGKFEVRRKGN